MKMSYWRNRPETRFTSTLSIGALALSSACLLMGAMTAPALASLSDNGAGGAVHEQTPIFAPDTYGGYASDHIMVKIKPGVHVRADANGDVHVNKSFDAALSYWGVHTMRPAMSTLAANHAVAHRIGMDRWYVLEVPYGTDTISMSQMFNSMVKGVDVAEISGIGGVALVPNDQYFNLQYSEYNTGQTINGRVGVPDADSDLTDAWDTWTGDDTMLLAVIDSGVDPHNEFADRMVPGWNTYDNTNNTSDGCPHGTHVTGIAGAKGNNGLGVAGADWGLKIMPVRVLLGCNGNTTQCADGITYAVDHGVNVGTMSLQYYSFAQYFEDSTDYAYDNNVLLIAANGNSQGNLIAWPAKFPHVMGVASTNNQDQRSSFSNYGPECDIAAAGEDVYSTWVGQGYTYLSGTSMATPLVSGIACLIWSYNHDLTNQDVWDILTGTADDLGSAGWDQYYGYGRVNAYQALLAASSGQLPLVLSSTELVHGVFATLDVSRATPGATVAFVYSTAGLGSTYVAQLNVTLGLAGPRLLGVRQADGNGDATLSKRLPPNSTGVVIWMQAAENGNTSNIVQKTVQ